MWTQIDSCIVWPNGKAYFFSGDEYIRYDVAGDHADPGYPKPIAANWPGLSGPVRAGVAWTNGKAYFFEGPDYWRYDIAADKVDPEYPKPIKGNWPGLSLMDVSTAAIWPSGKAYLFGGVPGPPMSFGSFGYVRYDVKADHQDAGYPKEIGPNWRGLNAVDGPFNGCLLWPNGKAYFFRGAEYWRYDIAADRVDPGYPKPIAGNWPGIPIEPPTPPRIG